MAAESFSPAYIWVPGQGPDGAALDRMTGAFPKPSAPMGEAWFMSTEREMYPQLLGDLATLPDDDILKSLEEITSGSTSFGLLGEWDEWYHYMLPSLIMRRWQPTYYQPAERLFSAFVNLHPDIGSLSRYPGFRADALNTLGRYIMSRHFWPNGKLDVAKCLGKWARPNGSSGWWSAGNLLSASLFFCAKYLSASDVEAWFRSVAAIPDRYWKVQIITWLVGANPMLAGEIDHPSQFPEIGPFDVSWDWAHVLRGGEIGHPFLPIENREAIIRVARAMEAEAFIEDCCTDPSMSPVMDELTGLPARFIQFYRN